MKIIKTAIYDNKVAQLVLKDDGVTVDIIYDGKVISSSGGNTWNNMKDDEAVQECMLYIHIQGYISESTNDKTLEAMLSI